MDQNTSYYFHACAEDLPNGGKPKKVDPGGVPKSKSITPANTNDSRPYVCHDYHDHSQETMRSDLLARMKTIKVAGSSSDAKENRLIKKPSHHVKLIPFPMKLHLVLSMVKENGFEHIISWQSHGRCFAIHRPKEFVEHVMPTYFNQTKLTSFQRQLNIYGFIGLTTGRDRGCYYHELFLEHKLFLCEKMKRMGIKGTGVKAKPSPHTEPDFYSMPKVKPDPDLPDTEMSMSMESNQNQYTEVSVPAVNINESGNTVQTKNFAEFNQKPPHISGTVQEKRNAFSPPKNGNAGVGNPAHSITNRVDIFDSFSLNYNNNSEASVPSQLSPLPFNIVESITGNVDEDLFGRRDSFLPLLTGEQQGEKPSSKSLASAFVSSKQSCSLTTAGSNLSQDRAGQLDSNASRYTQNAPSSQEDPIMPELKAFFS